MTWKQDERARAPALIPRLAVIFSVSEERVGLIVPAYMIPYGIATFFMGCWPIRVRLVPSAVATTIPRRN